MVKVLKNKKMGRPLLKIDLEVVEGLGKIQCTYAECATVLKVKEDTLKHRDDFLNSYKEGSNNGLISLRRLQFKHAETYAPMAMFLGKVYLGQKEQEAPNQNMDEYFKEIARAIRDTDG